MIFRKHILGPIALLSILLMSQMAVLVHSVEHPFHTPDHLCSAFLQCEASGNGLISPAIVLPVLPGSFLFVDNASTRFFFSPKTAYFARAPPLSAL